MDLEVLTDWVDSGVSVTLNHPVCCLKVSHHVGTCHVLVHPIIFWTPRGHASSFRHRCDLVLDPRSDVSGKSHWIKWCRNHSTRIHEKFLICIQRRSHGFPETRYNQFVSLKQRWASYWATCCTKHTSIMQDTSSISKCNITPLRLILWDPTWTIDGSQIQHCTATASCHSLEFSNPMPTTPNNHPFLAFWTHQFQWIWHIWSVPIIRSS